MGTSLEDGNLHTDTDRRLKTMRHTILGEKRAHLHAHATLFRGSRVNLPVVTESVVWLYLVTDRRYWINIW